MNSAQANAAGRGAQAGGSPSHLTHSPLTHSRTHTVSQSVTQPSLSITVNHCQSLSITVNHCQSLSITVNHEVCDSDCAQNKRCNPLTTRDNAYFTERMLACGWARVGARGCGSGSGCGSGRGGQMPADHAGRGLRWCAGCVRDECVMHLSSHSLTHSPTHSLTHSLTHPLTHSIGK